MPFQKASEADSSIIHVLLFANAASFYRSFTVVEFATFWLARVVAEHAPERFGGLIELKARVAPEPSELRLRAHMIAYCIVYILTMSILMHFMIFDHIFVLTVVWGAPMTVRRRSTRAALRGAGGRRDIFCTEVRSILMILWCVSKVGLAYHYMHTKASWSFYTAHLANLVSTYM